MPTRFKSPSPKICFDGRVEGKAFGEGIVKSCKNLGANHPPLEGGVGSYAFGEGIVKSYKNLDLITLPLREGSEAMLSGRGL